MAQVVKLKRTAVSGKVPSTSNLELGELAINTYDGRIFFEKDSGTPSIEQVVTTNSQTTGSINVNGNVTASYFFGDGSGLTNISTDIGEVATVTSSFDNSSTINVGHNFNSKNVIVSVYDNNDNQIIPQTVSLTDQDTVQVVLSSAQSGFVVVAKGGHVVSGSADDASNLNGQPASYYLDYDNFTNIPSGILSSSNETFTEFSQSVASDFAGLSTDYNDLQNIPSGIISSSLQLANTSVSNESLNTFTASAVTVSGSGTSGSLSVFSDTHTIVNSPITSVTSETVITHNNNGNTVFTVSGSNGELLSVDDDNTGNVFTVNDISGVPIFQVNNAITASTHLVPSQNVTYDLGSSTFRWRDLYLSGSTIDLGGTLLQRDTDGNVEFKDSQTDALKTLKIKELEIGEGDNKVKLKLDDNNKVKFEDSTSGDAKSESTFYKETVSSASKHIITHSLNEDYPIVQVYNSSKEQVIPENITSVNSNVVELEFTSNFSGVIVIKV